jgi:hypothetical protein
MLHADRGEILSAPNLPILARFLEGDEGFRKATLLHYGVEGQPSCFSAALVLCEGCVPRSSGRAN